MRVSVFARIRLPFVILGIGEEMEGELSEYVGFKLKPETRRKLDELAARTGRTPSQVLRLLLDGAEVASVPDVRAPLVRPMQEGAAPLSAAA